MDYKLKIKIGTHEFEAEGPAEAVKEQFEAFKELIQTLPAQPPSAPDHARIGPGTAPLSELHDLAVGSEGTAADTGDAQIADRWERHRADLAKFGIGLRVHPAKPPAEADAALHRIMKVENRIVSLTVKVRSIEDAVLLILFGQKVMRDNDSVTGSEVMDGLEISGLKVPRADRILAKLSDGGDAIAVGLGRAKRYRMTNTGMTKARALAAELLATVA